MLRAVAAYNGGPGTLLKTQAQLGADCDSLLLIESLPAQSRPATMSRRSWPRTGPIAA
jgi:soluble lytic murein transglycosylase-like protein